MALAPRRLPPLPTLKDILRIYNIKAQKKLSQNFIMDPRLLDKIARTAGNLDGKHVIEVGPGPGGITRSILGHGARRCYVIEKDPRFLPSLELLNEASGGRVEIILGDVLNFDMSSLLPPTLTQAWDSPSPDIVVAGNLPFNVSTPLLIRWIQAMANRDNVFTYGRVPLTLTFQHEVAHRIIAPPNDKERSRLSVLCQNWAHVQYNLTIPPGAFVPKPEVNVGLVTLTPLTKPYISLPFKLVEKVVTTLFHGKQKYLYNTAKNLFPPRMSRKLSGQMLLLADVDPYEKAINLNMKQLDCLCHAYRFLCDENKGVERFNFRQAKETLLEFSQKTELEEGVVEELGGSGLLLK